MQDDEIVKLYQQRDEAAIKETSVRYGRYLKKIAFNIVSDAEDVSEVINDVYLAVWNSIPPQKPAVLSLYLAKLTRRIAIDRVRSRTRAKRKASQFALSLNELDDCISAGNTTEQDADVHLLSEAI
ncbi:MAG: RNA polymerase subunit sigma-70, partial [Ruminococcaceae bacterium]|nr:RNA polymerase subunit sigma-70 [Oscillospiraceae bacterium]